MRRHVVTLISCLLVQTPAVQAEDATWSIDIGAGAVYAPRYLGSDKQQLQPFPVISAKYDDTIALAGKEGPALQFGRLPDSGFNYGIEAGYSFGLREKTGRLPKGFGRQKDALTAGLFLGYESDIGSIEFSTSKALTGHKGLTVEGSAAVGLPLFLRGKEAAPTIISVGPQFSYGDRKLARDRYAITPARALATGLPVADARSFWSYGATASLIHPLTSRVALIGFSSVDRIAGSSAKSVIVTQKTGVTAGAFITYRFGNASDE
jgi:MipA family protein